MGLVIDGPDWGAFGRIALEQACIGSCQSQANAVTLAQQYRRWIQRKTDDGRLAWNKGLGIGAQEAMSGAKGLVWQVFGIDFLAMNYTEDSFVEIRRSTLWRDIFKVCVNGAIACR